MSNAPMGDAWVGRIADERFPLLRWLGGAETFGVFLTETGEPEKQQAAIRLLPAGGDAENRLAQWQAAAALSHPHLLRIFAVGRCRIGDADVLYCVTECADEVLADVIRERALTPAEAREMLEPLLDALEYVHRQGLVLGGVKPANIVAVNDRLKVFADSPRRAGTLGAGTPDIYAAPEVAAEPITPAADLWSLGVTLVQTLARRLPEWGTGGDPALPESLPDPFAAIARQCLHRDPASRCTLGGVRELLAVRAEAAPEPEPAPPPRAEETSLKKSAWVPLLVLLVLAAATALWVSFHWRQPGLAAGQNSQLEASETAPSRKPPSAPPSPQPEAKGTVIAQVLPSVPEAAMQTIDGTVRLSVRVAVNAGGAVSSASIDQAGTSPYFVPFALAAARQWRFAPARAAGRAIPSAWVLHFELRRGGTEVQPEEVSP